MPVVDPTELRFYRCTSWEESDAHGGTINTDSEIISGNLNNIFDDVSNSERVNGMIDYRKIYVRNNNAGTWSNVLVWINQLTNATNDEIYIALGTDGGTKSDEGENLTYVQPTSAGHPDVLSIGDLAQYESQSIWIKRIVTAGGMGYTTNTFQIAAESIMG